MTVDKNRMAAAISRGTLGKIALAIAAYIALIIWPCFALLRLLLANDGAAFSPAHMMGALVAAVGVALFSYIVMVSLCEPGRARVGQGTSHE